VGGTLKTLAYLAPTENEERLHHPIFNAYQTIRNHHGTFERAKQSMIRHVHAGIDSGGRHVEHLLRIVT
jgi:hypothetical protein